MLERIIQSIRRKIYKPGLFKGRRIYPKKHSRARPENRVQKSIYYTPFAKRLVRENPGVIKGIQQFLRTPRKHRAQFRIGGMEFERINPNTGSKEKHGEYYQVKFNGKTFFLKTAPDLNEFEASFSLKEFLEKEGSIVDGIAVGVATYHGVYKGNAGNVIISDFYGNEFIHGLELEQAGRENENEIVEKTLAKLRENLSKAGLPLFDVKKKNCFYNPIARKIIIFDVIQH